LITRIISALIGIPLLILIVNKGGTVLTLSVLIVCLIGLKEFYNAFNNINIFPLNQVSYFFTITLFLGILFGLNIFIKFNFYLVTLTLLIINLFSKKSNFIDISVTLMGYFYITFSLLHIVLISNEYNAFIWLVFIIAMSTDTFAYFSGYFFGSRKLIPKVSPNKTIEGSIGGIIGCIILTVIFTYIINPSYIYHSVILAILGSIFSQIGDLIASKIKRYVGIKDFGKLIPGHGGIVDRFDSIFVITPFIYYYIYIFFK